MRQRQREQELSGIFEKAIHEPLHMDEIALLSISSKCALIRRILDQKQRQNALPKDLSDTTLLRLSKAFNISSAFHDWQEKRRARLIDAFRKEPGKRALSAFRRWNEISGHEKQQALRRSVRMHRDIYIEGIVAKLPYSHEFREGRLHKRRNVLSMTLGSFQSHLKTGESRVIQYLYNGALEIDPEGAFNTAHHEATHLIQHHLSFAFHRNQISPAHPLYEEAAYFHALDRHKAYIPSSHEAYSAQPNEVFADWEGTQISREIAELALH